MVADPLASEEGGYTRTAVSISVWGLDSESVVSSEGGGGANERGWSIIAMQRAIVAVCWVSVYIDDGSCLTLADRW